MQMAFFPVFTVVPRLAAVVTNMSGAAVGFAAVVLLVAILSAE